jgi:hypothetical protein
MKLLHATLAIAILDAVYSQMHWNLRQLGSSGGFFKLVSDAETIRDGLQLCIEVRNKDPKNDQKLVLGNCGGPNIGWDFDADGLFHAEKDDSFCMQAGRAGPVNDGEKVRMFHCDKDNELQLFEYDGGAIKPKSDTSLCMVWRGVNANIDRDPIIFKKCNRVMNRVQWSED